MEKRANGDGSNGNSLRRALIREPPLQAERRADGDGDSDCPLLRCADSRVAAAEGEADSDGSNDSPLSRRADSRAVVETVTASVTALAPTR